MRGEQHAGGDGDQRAGAQAAERDDQPRQTISTTSQRVPMLRSGKPRSAVSIALAWISGPGMFEPVDVGWMSWRLGADAPTTTTCPESAGGTC